MLRNMVTSLLRHERIQTTVAKAKEARRYAEKIITLGKKENLAARRRAYRFVSDEAVIKKVFETLAYRYVERKGGYTRIIRLGRRRGDGAEMVYLELVGRPEPEPEDKKGKKKEGKKKEDEPGSKAAKKDSTEEKPAEKKSEKKAAAKA